MQRHFGEEIDAPSIETGVARVRSRADDAAIRVDGTMLLDMEM
jgi:hypothetical protein